MDPTQLPEDAIFIVVSQDCDIVHDSFEAEPYVEFLVARAIPREKEDRGRFWGKQPRRFQFFHTCAGEEMLYEISIHDRDRVQRKILLDGLPSDCLDSGLKDVICRWVAKRYTRPAFPDAFNARCRHVREKLASLLKKRGDLILCLQIRLDPADEELGPETAYHLMLFPICSREVWENDANHREALRLVAKIEEALLRCSGVVVDEVQLVPEHRFSLEDLRNTDRWDYDYLTYRDESDTPIDGSLV